MHKHNKVNWMTENKVESRQRKRVITISCMQAKADTHKANLNTNFLKENSHKNENMLMPIISI